MNVLEIRNSLNIISEESSTADMLEDWITRNNASAESEPILYALIKHLEDTDPDLRAKVIQFINLSMGMDESINEDERLGFGFKDDKAKAEVDAELLGRQDTERAAMRRERIRKRAGRRLKVTGDWPNQDSRGRPYYDYDPKHLTQGPPIYDSTDNNPNELDELKEAQFIRNALKEGHITLPPIDTERYSERHGLEGPIRARNGRVVYYDPKEGMYYDPDTDMYISHDDWEEMNRH